MASPNGNNTYFQFSFDPYKWIEEGIAIAEKEGLGKEIGFSSVTSNSKKPKGKDYNKYGYRADSNKSVEEQFNLKSGLGSFLDQDLLNTVESIYRNINAKLDLGGDIKPARIKFTDKPIGVFDFSQASKGLIRPVEFFSLEDDKTINPDLVQKDELNGNEFYFYMRKEKQVVVERRQEGTTDIEKNCDNVQVRKNQKLNLYLPYRDGEVLLMCGEYKLRFTSTNKKVYALREKKGGGIAPYVDLYLACGNNWNHDPESMLIQMMPNLLLGRILEKSGVRVRLFGYYVQNISSNVYTNSFFMMKNYGEPLDINKVAVFTSDTRFFRYWMWNAKQGWNYEMTKSKDYGGSDGSMYQPEQWLRNIMPMVRNYVSYKIDSGDFPSQVVNKKLMLFGGLNADADEKLDTPETEEKIINKFYQLLDYISIRLSNAPTQVIKEIVKRERDKGVEDREILKNLRDAITDILTPTSLQQKSIKQIKEEFKNGDIDKELYERAIEVNSKLDTQENIDEIIDERIRYEDIAKKVLGIS